MISLGLYAVAGLFWVPVVFMQIEIRDLAPKAAEQNRELPSRCFALFHRWFLLGIPGFWLGHGYSLVEDRQTVLGSMNADMRKILVLGASGLIDFL